ncbi:4-hydroxy-3-methylbut-2-enyl diphosphate reductase [Desulfococcaceae bacterium HSG9]|nr:4-hydroxy-3-methylbut-2-enyl diphosphate reductase [Desulfococcaceae bacterium HSG9]
MKLIVAQTAGFCMGVQRAVELAMAAPAEHINPIYTFGPLIHNPQVLDVLKSKGVTVIEKIPEQGTGTMMIRAHGVTPHVKAQIRKAGFKIIDATCPRVTKVHTIITRYANQGCATIIWGEADHPEVIGLLGCTGKKGFVADTIDQLNTLPSFENAIIVAQTTQNMRAYAEVKNWVNQERPHYKIFNTICDSTAKRQDEVKQLALEVDAVIVVGGYNSGNTKRLAEIVKESGKSALHIETAGELNAEILKDAQSIGISAGASTPDWIIDQIYETLKNGIA